MTTTEYTLSLPTSATPKLKYRVILDGSEFTFLFQWFARGDSSWHLSIYDNQETLIISNMKLVSWFDLLSSLVNTELPLGKLGLVCISEPFPKAPVITLDNLSTDFQLLYYSTT